MDRIVEVGTTQSRRKKKSPSDEEPRIPPGQKRIAKRKTVTVSGDANDDSREPKQRKTAITR
jgi:hypothetical protein